jgi:regulator of cell morphogenesis and NO signaling
LTNIIENTGRRSTSLYPQTIPVYPNPVIDFYNLNSGEIIHYISSKDHEQIRQSVKLCEKLFLELGEQQNAAAAMLLKAQSCFKKLCKVLDEHLNKEDEILFPYALEILKPQKAGEPLPVKLSVGLLKNPLQSMNQEHELLMELLMSLRRGMGNYFCGNNYSSKMRLLCSELFILEQSLFWHFFLQENVLYPKLRRDENDRLITKTKNI